MIEQVFFAIFEHKLYGIIEMSVAGLERLRSIQTTPLFPARGQGFGGLCFFHQLFDNVTVSISRYQSILQFFFDLYCVLFLAVASWS